MTRTFACLAVTLLAAAPAARGHDPEFTPKQLAKVRACVEHLGKILKSGALNPEAAWSFDLGEFTPHELGHVPEAIGDLDPDLREALRHVCQTTYYRRGPAGRVEGAREICFYLAGPRDMDCLRAFRLLRREKLGQDLERTVVALGRDDRPDVRLVAGRLAKSLIVFGHGSEGLLGTVLACLTDRDPNVAATCANPDVFATREKRVVDRVVAALADVRTLNPLASPADQRRVSDVMALRLSWAIFMERRALWMLRPKLGATGEITLDRTGEPEYEALSPNAIRAWWKEHRDKFGFGTPASHWKSVVDRVVVLEVRKPVQVKAADGVTLTVNLGKYEEGWFDGKPVTSAEAEITASEVGEKEHVATVGAGAAQPDGSLSWEGGIWADGKGLRDFICQGAFLPTDKPGRVRLRLIVHISHEERK